MNEMKIRFWDKKLNVMWEPIELKKLLGYMLFQSMPNSDGYTALKDHFDDMVIEQFTGLKDKNGKDVYEGDVVRHDAVLYKEVGSVVFCEGAYELVHLDGNFLCHLWSDIEERFEVIGNIYEGDTNGKDL